MTERIGLEAVFDDSDFERGISRYMALVQEATDITELAASTIGDALKSISSGADLSALSTSTQAVGQAFDALALNVEGSVQIASEAIDKLALNTEAASNMASLAIRGLATDSVDAANDVTTAANTISASAAKAGDEASFAFRALATDTSDAAIKTKAAAESMAQGVADAFGKIPPAVSGVGDEVGKLPAQVTPPLEETKEKIKGVGDKSEETSGRVKSSFGGISQALTAAQPGIDFFREVTVGAFRQVGAIITNELQNAMQNLRAFAGELIATAAAQTPLAGTLQDLKEKMAGVTLVSFEPLFNQLDTLIQKAEPAFLSVMQSAETYLGGIAQDAFSWGEGAISEFANGMIAAIGAVVSALADIANMVAFYLMPHSPPKLLPDIDDWGTETAQIWMDGWGKVDYGVFDQISGTIESLIRSLPLGKDSGGDVINRILGSREGIAAAVDELRSAGAISESAISSIVGAVGAASDEVSGYIRSLAALTAANEDLQSAQDNLNRVTKEYDDLLKPIDSALSAISEEQQQLSEDNRISQLQLVANDPNASLAEKAQARLEIEKILAERKRRALLAEKAQAVDNAKAEVDAAQQAQQAAQEAFDQNKARIDFLTEQNRLLQEQLRLQEQLEKPAAGGGGGGKPSGIKLPPIGGFGDPFDGMFDELQSKLGGLQTAFSTAFDAIKQKLQPAIDAFENVKSGWGNLVSAFEESGPRIKNSIAQAIAYVVTIMGINLPTIFDNVGKSLDSLAGIWRKHGDTIMSVIGGAWNFVVSIVGSSITAVSGLIAIGLNTIEGIMDAFSLALQGKWDEAFATILITMNENFAIAEDTFHTMMDSILAIWGTSWDEVLRVLNDTLESIVSGMAEKINAVVSTWEENWDSILITLKTTWDNITKEVDTRINEAKTTLDTVGTAISTAWETLWNTIKTTLDTKWTEITTAVSTGIEAAKKAISDSIDSFKTLGDNIIGGIKSGIDGAVAGLAAAAAAAAKSALDAAKAALGIQSPSKLAAALVGKPFVQGIEVGVKDSIPSLERTVKVASGAMLGAGATTITNAQNNSRNITFAPVYNGNPPPQQMDFATAWALSPGK